MVEILHDYVSFLGFEKESFMEGFPSRYCEAMQERQEMQNLGESMQLVQRRNTKLLLYVQSQERQSVFSRVKRPVEATASC